MSEKLNNLYILARRARDNGDSGSAARYYEQILLEDPNSWEATFYSDYYTAASCIIRDIGPAANRVARAFVNAAKIIWNSDVENKTAVLVQMCESCMSLLNTLSTAAYNHYMQHSSVNGAHGEYRDRVLHSGNAICTIGDFFYSVGDKQNACVCYKSAPALWKGQFGLNEVALSRIKEVDPAYEPPKTGGCYVATAVYGSYDCPQVWTLRRYRDNVLAQTWYGRAFIKTYYAISPTLVKWFGHTAWFKNLWKGKLDRMVENLQQSGVESTPYADKNW